MDSQSPSGLQSVMSLPCPLPRNKSPGWRRCRWSSLFALALIGICACGWQPVRPKWNVVLITLDTTRADRLGCYGHSTALTPALDGLAERGVLFERAYAPVPLTLPSHATILTGLYPPEHGLRVNGQGSLPAGIPTLATRLQSVGYENGAFIAAPIVLKRMYGLHRGFDTYDDDDSNSVAGLQGHYGYRPANIIVDAALRWLQPRAEKPFCCWIHLYDPHFPYLDHADNFSDRFREQPYDAEIAYVDQQIQRVLVALDRWKIAERTVVVVVADHGESFNEHGERTHGLTLYDAALRVPLIFSVPGNFRPGHRVSQPVSLVDVCPTVLDVLGLEPIASVSGRSLTEAFQGGPLPDEPLYAETDEPFHEARCAPLRALITPEWKYIRSPRTELYDLRNDPMELVNLAEKEPAVLQRFEEQLSAREELLRKSVAEKIALTDAERRALQSLGYAAGNEPGPDGDESLADIKAILPLCNQFNDADALIESGRAAEAEPMLREILAAHDDYFKAHDRLGRCLLQLHRPREAIAAFRRSLELDPGADRVRSMLGVALYSVEDYPGAVEELEQALRTSGELIEARYNLGLAYEKTGRLEDAIAQYELCLDQMPHFAPARQRLDELHALER